MLWLNSFLSEIIIKLIIIITAIIIIINIIITVISQGRLYNCIYNTCLCSVHFPRFKYQTSYLLDQMES